MAKETLIWNPDYLALGGKEFAKMKRQCPGYDYGKKITLSQYKALRKGIEFDPKEDPVLIIKSREDFIDKAAAGVIVGKSDIGGRGGVDAVTPDGEPILVGGGEIIMSEKAARDNCEELSKMNQEAGGVAFDCDLQKVANTDRASGNMPKGEYYRKSAEGGSKLPSAGENIQFSPLHIKMLIPEVTVVEYVWKGEKIFGVVKKVEKMQPRSIFQNRAPFYLITVDKNVVPSEDIIRIVTDPGTIWNTYEQFSRYRFFVATKEVSKQANEMKSWGELEEDTKGRFIRWYAGEVENQNKDLAGGGNTAVGGQIKEGDIVDFNGVKSKVVSIFADNGTAKIIIPFECSKEGANIAVDWDYDIVNLSELKPIKMAEEGTKIPAETQYKEAQRYIDNARADLKKAGLTTDGKYYYDTKYVKSAAGTAYAGAELALKWFLESHGIKSKITDASEIKRHLSMINKKMLKTFHTVYETLHKNIYYGSDTRKSVVDGVIDAAEDLIAYLRPYKQPAVYEAGTKTQERTQYQEAMRYIDNAKDELKKAGVTSDGQYYKDEKYVKSAGGIAYAGVELAMKWLLKLKGIKIRGEDADAIKDGLAKFNKKLLKRFNTVHINLHKYAYYGGDTTKSIIDTAIGVAKELIEQLKPYKQPAVYEAGAKTNPMENENKERHEYFISGSMYDDTIAAVKYMKRNTNQWAIRDTLLKFTKFGFWSGQDMAIINIDLANQIVNELQNYVEEIKNNESNLAEVYDIVYHYSHRGDPAASGAKTNPMKIKPTHLTLYGFGGLLKEGVPVVILKEDGEKVFVQDVYGNGWHGEMKDLITIRGESVASGAQLPMPDFHYLKIGNTIKDTQGNQSKIVRHTDTGVVLKPYQDIPYDLPEAEMSFEDFCEKMDAGFVILGCPYDKDDESNNCLLRKEISLIKMGNEVNAKESRIKRLEEEGETDRAAMRAEAERQREEGESEMAALRAETERQRAASDAERSRLTAEAARQRAASDAEANRLRGEYEDTIEGLNVLKELNLPPDVKKLKDEYEDTIEGLKVLNQTNGREMQGGGEINKYKISKEELNELMVRLIKNEKASYKDLRFEFHRFHDQPGYFFGAYSDKGMKEIALDSATKATLKGNLIYVFKLLNKQDGGGEYAGGGKANGDEYGEKVSEKDIEERIEKYEEQGHGKEEAVAMAVASIGDVGEDVLAKGGSDLMSDKEFTEAGVSKNKIKYLKNAEKLVKSGKASDIDDIQTELGYGVVDEDMLKDTFFPEYASGSSMAAGGGDGTSRVFKRTFEALNYPKFSTERAKLNEDSLTSEYMHSYKYEARIYHPRTETHTAYTDKRSFRTKSEAEKYVVEKSGGSMAGGYDITEADEAAKDKKTALANFEYQIVNGETMEVIDMFERAARDMGASTAEIEEIRKGAKSGSMAGGGNPDSNRTQAFIEQTAKDYDMPVHEVERIDKLYPNNFYEKLEEYISGRAKCGSMAGGGKVKKITKKDKYYRQSPKP